MAIEKDRSDQLLAGRDPDELFAKDGLLDELKKALSERILATELDEHLEDEQADDGSPGPRPQRHVTTSIATIRHRRAAPVPPRLPMLRAKEHATVVLNLTR